MRQEHGIWTVALFVALAGCGGSGGGGGGGSASLGSVSSGSGTGGVNSRSGPFTGGSLATSTNPIDQAALLGLKAAGVDPVPVAGDVEFIRRVTADVLGRLPTPTEVSTFVSNTSPAKRDATIDALLASPEFATHWSKDILTAWACVNSGTAAFQTALEADLNAKRPLGAIVHDFANASGTAGTIYASNFRDPTVMMDQFMLSFSGMSSECARCHDHHLTTVADNPKWVQDDNYGLYAFVAMNNGQATKVDLTNKKIGQPVQPNWVVDGYQKAITSGLPTLTDPVATRRLKFADLFVASDAFARGTGHRIFAEVMDPLLDPNQFLASNLQAVQQPALLQEITTVFKQQNASLQGFLAVVLKSKLYQLTTAGTTTANDKLFARRTLRRHHSEVIEAGVSLVAGVPFKSQTPFQQSFGYPIPQRMMTLLERTDGVNLSQPLILLNSPISTNSLITGSGSLVPTLATQVGAGKMTRSQAISQIVTTGLGRAPTAAELSAIVNVCSGAATDLEALQDVAVAVCATTEFVAR
jgi:hypothetical protein